MVTHKTLALALCIVVSGCSSFETTNANANTALAKAEATAAKMPKPEVTQAWLDDYEPKLREAIKGTHFELERRQNVLVVTAPVQGSFNPDRPELMLPVILAPLTRIGKLLGPDPSVGVLVLGHADSTGDAAANRELSQKRAGAFTSIFRMSGLNSDRLTVKGMGANNPRAANDSVEGRALNRRVEIMLTSKTTLNALIAKYTIPDLQPATALAATDSKASASSKEAKKPAAKTVAKTATPSVKGSKTIAKADKPTASKP